MNLENITLSERSQTEKNKYHMIPLVCNVKDRQIIETEIEDWLCRAGAGLGSDGERLWGLF